MNKRQMILILIVMATASSTFFRCGKSKKDNSTISTVNGSVASGKF